MTRFRFTSWPVNQLNSVRYIATQYAGQTLEKTLTGIRKRGNKIMVLALLASLAACDRSPVDLEKIAAKKVEHCQDHPCEGDPVIPVPEGKTLVKLNNQFFLVPSDYGGTGSLAFYWPSRTPISSPNRDRDAPEFIPRTEVRENNVYEVLIQIFMRSTVIPSVPIDFNFMQTAIAEDRIANIRNVRAGLQSFTMKPTEEAGVSFRDSRTYYVATDLKGFDGLPPLATCSHDHPRNFGGAGFIWKHGIWVGVSMNQKHCKDWPEIFIELTHILSKIQKVSP